MIGVSYTFVRSQKFNQGFTLVELMVSLVLGLLVIAGVGSLFLANKQAYQSSEGLSEYQENIRYLFEMMTRDIRQADGTPCRKRDSKFGPQINIPGIEWGEGIQGYTGNEASADQAFGDGTANRITETDALRVTGSSRKVFKATHTGDVFTLDGKPNGRFFIVCDLDSGSVFEATISGTSLTDISGSTSGRYTSESHISAFTQAFWYLGCNGQASCDTADGRSVYRARNNLASAGGENPNPIINGVKSLQFDYLTKGASEYIETVDYWSSIVAVRVTIDLYPPQSGSLIDKAGIPLTSRLSHVIALRNRIQP